MTRLIVCALALGIAGPVFAEESDPGLSKRPTISVGLSQLDSMFTESTPMCTGAVRRSTSSAPSHGERCGALAAQAAGRGASDRPHEFGLGGKAGGFTFGVGASARVWQSERVGLQVDLSHYGIGSVGLLQVAPSVLFVLGEPDLTKDTQIRPYAGGGINFLRASYSSLGSDTGVGGQGFVGAELVFAGAPRFGLSGDLGYYSTGNFFGVGFGGFALSVAGHYYIR